MILTKTKPSQPYIRSHKVVNKFTVIDFSYQIVQYTNNGNYGIIITDDLTKEVRLLKPSSSMATLKDVADAFRSSGRFKEALIAEAMTV